MQWMVQLQGSPIVAIAARLGRRVCLKMIQANKDRIVVAEKTREDMGSLWIGQMTQTASYVYHAEGR